MSLTVTVELFLKNRRRLVESLRKVVSAGSVVLLQGGSERNRYNTDATDAPFRQESYFYWAFGLVESGCYGAIDVDSGRSLLFPAKLDPGFAVWNGPIESEEWFKKRYAVDEVHFHEKNVVAEKLTELTPKCLLLLRECKGHSPGLLEPADFLGKENFNVDTELLYPVMTNLRLLKTDEELDALRYANKISTEGHKTLMKNVRPGLYEYQMESLFKHVCHYSGGCRYLAYTCIAASGKNCAVLHYGGANAPNSKTIQDGDMCLFDMGPEYNCYASDVTCSFPANGKFTGKQKIVYNAVLRANRAVFHAAKPGVLYSDMSRLAEKTMLIDLKKAGLLVGCVNEMMSAKLGNVFMPHGLGHHIGLDVHDACTAESELGKRALEERMVITIEPGLYFIDALLDKALSNPDQAKFIVEKKLREFREVGGVRIEDCIIIWAGGNENMSSDLPRTVEELDAFMSKKVETVEPQSKFSLTGLLFALIGLVL